jgi:hypothetical protein
VVPPTGSTSGRGLLYDPLAKKPPKFAIKKQESSENSSSDNQSYEHFHVAIINDCQFCCCIQFGYVGTWGTKEEPSSECLILEILSIITVLSYFIYMS